MTHRNLLRNLDKICLGPTGQLVNSEPLKSDKVVLLFNKGLETSDEWKELKTKLYQVEIEGEVINLKQFKHSEIVAELVKEIKQSKEDWEIKKSVFGSDSGLMIQHKSGRRHWKSAFLTYEHWDEIKALLKNKDKSLVNLKNIEKITLNRENLVIEFKGNENNKTIAQIITPEQMEDNQELQAVKNYCQKNNKTSLNQQEISDFVNSDFVSTKESEKNNTPLLIGGGVAVLVIGLIIGVLIGKNSKNKK